MARTPPRHTATYADLANVPDTKVGELIGGELVVSPRPGSLQARAATRLLVLLLRRFDRGSKGPEGWVILKEPELHLSGDALVPDLVGWRRTRMPVMPYVDAFTLAPDWVCEVTSPITVSLDRGAKMEAYAREGVEHLWFVDPLTQSLEVYWLAEGGLRLLTTYEDSAAVRAKPFDALELELGLLWER